MFPSVVSFDLLDRRARHGDAFALGSIAIMLLRETRAPDGTPDPRAVAIIAGAAAAGCARCSRMLYVYGRGHWPGWSFTDEQVETLWLLHRRNERRRELRVGAARQRGVSAEVVAFSAR